MRKGRTVPCVRPSRGNWHVRDRKESGRVPFFLVHKLVLCPSIVPPLISPYCLLFWEDFVFPSPPSDYSIFMLPPLLIKFSVQLSVFQRVLFSIFSLTSGIFILLIVVLVCFFFLPILLFHVTYFTETVLDWRNLFPLSNQPYISLTPIDNDRWL